MLPDGSTLQGFLMVWKDQEDPPSGRGAGSHGLPWEGGRAGNWVKLVPRF